MTDSTTNNPVVFIIFNRPDTTRKALDCIRLAKPKKLFVIADGPRRNKTGEAELCAAARAVIETIDWPCEVLKNYSDVNLGCKKRVSSGLDWVFNTVEQAIILEDDCIPHPTFFRFCDELLEKYRDDTRIMAIAGDNYQFGARRTEDSYYFSRYFHCWGWATWRRSWRFFDIEMKLWPQVRENRILGNLWSSPEALAYWHEIFDQVYENKVDSWAYRMLFACFIQSGLSILPDVNLVSNIGFDQNATHTRRGHRLEDLPVEPMQFPLRHPSAIMPNRAADDFTQENVYQGKPPRIKALLGPIYLPVKWLFGPFLRPYLRRKYDRS